MQNNDLSGAQIAVMLVVYGIIFLVALAIQAGICYVLYRAASAIPPNHRRTTPGKAFLLLIPIFNLIWLFIYPKQLSQSFQSYFASVGQQKDDCGEQIGLWWAITSALSIIPCVNMVTGIAALVLMIIYLVKVSECRSRALALKGGGIPMAAPTGQTF